MPKFIQGSTLNDVLPRRPRPPLPDRDARDYALRRLREFLSVLNYRRTAAPGEEPIAFRIPKSNIHVYQPDDIVNLPLPGFAFVPGRGFHETYGLGPPAILESTRDVYGPGTALVRFSDYVETFTLECWAGKHAERRAMMAGVKTALRQNDGSYAIKLTLPEYFDQVAEFSLDESYYVDGDQVVRNRRRGHLFVGLRVVEVGLANFNELNPVLQGPGGVADVEVLDGNLYPTLDC